MVIAGCIIGAFLLIVIAVLIRAVWRSMRRDEKSVQDDAYRDLE